MEGAVNSAYEAVVTLAVQGPSGQTREIEAVIDTGFSGFLTVTPALVTELGLRYRSRGWATLADGSEVTFPSYGVAVLWDGQRRYIDADAADTTPLVGMRLLDGHSLHMDVLDGGRVAIAPVTAEPSTP
ncbi:MAG: clan AA aspartic protease [Chloroflexi bacterium]|nr:clan AA aspartic protease [Chloroflexota bacterium]